MLSLRLKSHFYSKQDNLDKILTFAVLQKIVIIIKMTVRVLIVAKNGSSKFT